MNPNGKIQAHHQQRRAVVYIRQSTPRQVEVNQESTRRQYQLVETAKTLGWPLSLIEVIDSDLGRSGVGGDHRPGFQQLVASLSMGEIGIVLVTEVSRLSRLNSDWHRVIELCAMFEALIADEDGIYDPSDLNDGLVLGLKGTIFATELRILRARMRTSLLNKAKRGELVLRLPIGYRRLADGSVILEPDEQVQGTLHLIFEQFEHLGSARAVQRYFYEKQLPMPRLPQTGPERDRLIWVKPTYQMIHQVLISPVYAGVFVYGRRKQRVMPGDTPQVSNKSVPLDEWEIVVPDVYPAYITYDQYLKNRQVLRDNMYNFKYKGRGAVRQGQALLQGILICGRCGRRMSLSYSTKYLGYACRREQLTYAAKQCQSFNVRYLDEAITEIFLEAIQPAQLDMMLTALEVLEQERQALDRQWQLRLERARYEVQRAQRQYDAVEPEHRLVVRQLEKRWNDALLALRQLEQNYEVVQQTELAPLSASEQQAVRQLATDLPALWHAATTTAADRKRLLRLVIQEVTLTAYSESRSAEFTILWSGGTTTAHHVKCPPIGWHCVTDQDSLQLLRKLAKTLPDHLIAEHLNAEGFHTKTGKRWTYERVKSIRKQHDIPSHCPINTGKSTPRGDGMVPVKTAADRLNVSTSLIHLWAKSGVLLYDQRVFGSKRWVRVTRADLIRLNGSAKCDHLPTFNDIMQELQVTRDQLWALVRAGHYTAYRTPLGRNWEWRLEAASSDTEHHAPPHVSSHKDGIPHYE